MILVIDNYDSFVHTLARYIGEAGFDRQVVRNDAIDIGDIETIGPSAIVISPGPCTPAEAGISTDVVRAFAGRVPILGVCLGHQCIAAAYGGTVTRARVPRHGKTTDITHDGTGLFKGLASPLRAAQYNSLVVTDPPPGPFRVSARSAAGEIMALRHESVALHGVQFHPESVLTEHGDALIANFCRLTRNASAREFAQ